VAELCRRTQSNYPGILSGRSEDGGLKLLLVGGIIMPQQSLLRIFKRCRLYVDPTEGVGWEEAVRVTRGVYVLYQKKGKNYNVKYIGIGGSGNVQKTGVFARLKQHQKYKSDWTHYSIFEVHDNITGEEIRELEGLFLMIFRNDENVQLVNKQKKMNKFLELSEDSLWLNEFIKKQKTK
jgi:hypothetical protein